MVVSLYKFNEWLLYAKQVGYLTDDVIAQKAGVTIDCVRAWLNAKSIPTANNLQNLVNALGYEFKIDGEVIRTDNFENWMVKEAKARGMSENVFSSWLDLCTSYISMVRKLKYIAPCTMQYIVDKCGKQLEIVKIA